MNYTTLTDEEINELVIKKLILMGFYTDDPQEVSHRQYVRDGWCWGRGTETGMRNKDGSIFVTHQNGHRIDYCSDASLAWAIISDSQISILWNWNEEGLHGATAFPLYEHEHENALRAAMTVFLMMQESANVQTNPARPDIR